MNTAKQLPPIATWPPLPPSPATLAELIATVEGYRNQLDEFSHRTSLNLEHLREQLEARLAACNP